MFYKEAPVVCHNHLKLPRRQSIFQKSKRCFADYLNTNLAFSCRISMTSIRVNSSRFNEMKTTFKRYDENECY